MGQKHLVYNGFKGISFICTVAIADMVITLNKDI